MSAHRISGGVATACTRCARPGPSEQAKGNAWDFLFVNAAFGPGGRFRDFCPACVAAGEIDRFCAAHEARSPFIPLQRRPALRLVTTEKETSA